MFLVEREREGDRIRKKKKKPEGIASRKEKKKNSLYMNVVLNRMRVVNVGAAQIMIVLTASTSSSDQNAPVISNLFNDGKSESDDSSGVSVVSILANPTLVRLSDSRWENLNPEKRESGRCMTFSKWNAVREGRWKRSWIMERGVSGLFPLNMN